MRDDPGRHLITHRAPPGLLDRALSRPLMSQEARPRASWRAPLAIAAAFCLGVLLGRIDRTAEPTAPVTGNTAEALAAQSVALTPIRLVFHADQATTVGVAGSWNGWEPEPMQSTAEGVFFTVVPLPPGRHEYMFVIDGKQWASDPTALLTHDDGFGQKNAVLQIGV
jgi:hypothetical protein